MRIYGFIALAMLMISACSNNDEKDSLANDQAEVDYDIALAISEQPLSFMDEVQPVLDKRCVVCHGCYDAPCQLKLNSHAGISRGANPQKVYDGERIKATPKTRLFVDAQTTEQWRQKGFHSVLNEEPNATPKNNLENSLMYKMLRQKQLYPQPKTGMLSEDIDISLNRKQQCVQPDKFDKFAREHPDWGMPFGLPNLPEQEYTTLVQWLGQGAPGSPSREIAAASVPQIVEWEAFLNQSGLRAQLVSRYIYEHLIQGHIHFAGAPEREFFRLIRSTTPPGQPAIEIASDRPYSAPGQEFWYRVKLYEPHIVIKDHVPYEWSAAKMQRYQELFFDVDYEVTEQAPYGRELASNPFRVFQEIPADSRYRFMLDDARFYIQGFIKGPVCRGQIALDVIADQFWIVFADPTMAELSTNQAFLKQATNYLELPADRGNTLDMLAIWTDYWKREKAYLKLRWTGFEDSDSDEPERLLEYIWNGDQTNPNAALTVFRHTDSASVRFGHLGDYPETAWVIDYPLLERIHYLLVVGYDVYGNVGHQLNTRLYMDFLRMEAEEYFLVLLPQQVRKQVHDSWYVGVHAQVEKHFNEPKDWMNVKSGIQVSSDHPVAEVLALIDQRLGAVAGPPDFINRCDGLCVENDSDLPSVEAALHRATAIKGEQLLAFPDMSFLRIRTPDGQPDLAYTIVVNKGYANLNSMFENEDKRDPAQDTLTILPGFVGSYPNYIYVVDLEDIGQFSDTLAVLQNPDDYERFDALYGIRRTNEEFWKHSDWFHSKAVQADPVESGIFDLNRYRNR